MGPALNLNDYIYSDNDTSSNMLRDMVARYSKPIIFVGNHFFAINLKTILILIFHLNLKQENKHTQTSKIFKQIENIILKNSIYFYIYK